MLSPPSRYARIKRRLLLCPFASSARFGHYTYMRSLPLYDCGGGEKQNRLPALHSPFKERDIPRRGSPGSSSFARKPTTLTEAERRPSTKAATATNSKNNVSPMAFHSLPVESFSANCFMRGAGQICQDLFQPAPSSTSTGSPSFSRIAGERAGTKIESRISHSRRSPASSLFRFPSCNRRKISGRYSTYSLPCRSITSGSDNPAV